MASRPASIERPPPGRLALTAADLRGLARLGVDATVGVTDLVETMHAAIAGLAPPIGVARSTRTSGITGFVYRRVRGTTRLVGGVLDAALGLLPGPAGPAARAPAREAFVAALNGVFGDRLAAAGNPLAIPTTLRADAVPPGAGPAAPRRALVLVHGLCMNDLQWRRGGHDHGERLAREAGWTVLRLHYNSGRPVTEVGRELAARLEALALGPGAPDAFALLGHSMGGLVARAACDAGAAAGHAWRARPTTLVTLGTPHLGAPLERGGHALERLLGASPYSAAFARLGAARSAGIVDLRHGLHAPPPAGVRLFAIAATTAAIARGARVGDGLVPIASALGRHRDASRSLGLPASRTAVIASANHWDLLDHPDVRGLLDRWLA